MTGWTLGAVLWLLALLPIGAHGRQLSHSEMTALVSRYSDWPAQRMVQTFTCESRGYVFAVSPTGDLGWTQIHALAWYRNFVPTWLLEVPQYAAYAAHEIWLQQGLAAWGCAS